MAERKTGAGSHLSGVLERSQQPKPEPSAEPNTSPVEAGPRGRGAVASKASRAPVARTAKRIKGRTVYLPDDLFERIIVQAHRKDLTISDYIAALLDRHVPDHRRIGAGASATGQTDSGDSDAA
jgi:hypothetical protein